LNTASIYKITQKIDIPEISGEIALSVALSPERRIVINDNVVRMWMVLMDVPVLCPVGDDGS